MKLLRELPPMFAHYLSRTATRLAGPRYGGLLSIAAAKLALS